MSADLFPAVELDRIARLRILAASIPGAVLEERLLAAPFERVWGFISDLEHSVPAFDRAVPSLRVVSVLADDGTERRLRARTPFLGFDVVLRPGWCWMTSSLYVVGMAAVSAGEATTRVAHLEGVPGGQRGWRGVINPLAAAARPLVRHEVHADLNGIERCLGLRPGR